MVVAGVRGVEVEGGASGGGGEEEKEEDCI